MTERATCNCTALRHGNHSGQPCSEPAITASGLCGVCAFIAWSEKQAKPAREPPDSLG
jgi:hypothetical protein